MSSPEKKGVIAMLHDPASTSSEELVTQDPTTPRAEDVSVASMDDYRPTPVPDVSIESEPVRPLRSALRELRASDPGFPTRAIGFSIAGAAIALALFWVGRSVVRGRRKAPRPARSAARAVGRELGREIAARAMLGAASVIGARIASDVLMPALMRKLESENARPKRRPRPSK